MALVIHVDKMSTSEKIAAMEAIWQSLSGVPSDVPSPPWHGEVLKAREESIQSGNAAFGDWEECKKELRKTFS